MVTIAMKAELNARRSGSDDCDDHDGFCASRDRGSWQLRREETEKQRRKKETESLKDRGGCRREIDACQEGREKRRKREMGQKR